MPDGLQMGTARTSDAGQADSRIAIGTTKVVTITANTYQMINEDEIVPSLLASDWKRGGGIAVVISNCYRSRCIQSDCHRGGGDNFESCSRRDGYDALRDDSGGK